MPRLSLLEHTSAQIVELAKLRLTSGAGIARELYRFAYETGSCDPEAWLRASPSALRLAARSVAGWREHFAWKLPQIRTVVDEVGEHGVTSKAVLVLEDGYEIECVLIPMPGDRATICVSSQVGCKMACSFCETGRLGLLRQLRVDEIVGQMVATRQKLGWRFRNVVFMGMGDALDNADAVFQAIRVANDPFGLGLSQERMTICTVGTQEGLLRMKEAGLRRVGLSISLNAGDDETRSRIMPANRRLPMARLAELLADYRPRANFVLGVNYCLLPGINDARHDAANVAAFCRQIPRVLVHVIPYNPGNLPLTRAPNSREVADFVDWLREEKIPVRQREIKGRSVMAACGQLGNVEFRRFKKPMPVSRV
jgi:23S rRNA (adenine2503-C2)-methyltransferase